MEPLAAFGRRKGLAWELVSVVALATAIAALWMWHYQMWTGADWRVPLDYGGDAHEILTRIKAASEGDTWPLAPQVVERLGAPWGAHWNAYPTPDKLLMLVLGALTRAWGLGMAANVAVMAAAVSSGLAFYGVARRLRVRREWAFATALLFAFTYAVFQRGLAHLSLLFSWTIPLGLAACWIVGRRRAVDWRRGDAALAVVASAALGASNPYNLFFWGQLMLWACLVQAFGARRAANLRLGAACLLIALATFLVSHAELWLYAQSGALPLLVRNYGGTEMYALKPVEMFIPPSEHRWDLLAFFGQRYGRWVEWRGEPYLPYLGVVGIVGFLWMMGEAVRRLLSGRAPRGFALQTGWILSYATVGGLTNLLALFAGFQVFRATNRVSVFISCWALLFLALRLSRYFGPPRRRQAGWAVAGLLALIGVLDQIPHRRASADRALRIARYSADEAFGRALEAALPVHSMLFQLPILGFPEVQPPHRLVDYELFRPYLHTTSLRFSYGGAKLRSRTRWQRELEGLSTAELVARLEQYGFAAVYLNRRGFEDGGASLMEELRHLGYTRVLESGRQEQLVVLLNPASHARLPVARGLTFGEGWYLQPELQEGHLVRWSHGSSVLTYYNPYREPRNAVLRLRLSAEGCREVAVSFRGDVLARASIGPEPCSLPPIRLTLKPGVNRLDLSSVGPPVRAGDSPSRLRAVGLHEGAMELEGAEESPAGS